MKKVFLALSVLLCIATFISCNQPLPTPVFKKVTIDSMENTLSIKLRDLKCTGSGINYDSVTNTYRVWMNFRDTSSLLPKLARNMHDTVKGTFHEFEFVYSMNEVLNWDAKLVYYSFGYHLGGENFSNDDKLIALYEKDSVIWFPGGHEWKAKNDFPWIKTPEKVNCEYVHMHVGSDFPNIDVAFKLLAPPNAIVLSEEVKKRTIAVLTKMDGATL